MLTTEILSVVKIPFKVRYKSHTNAVLLWLSVNKWQQIWSWAIINNKTSSCFYANLWTVHHIKQLRGDLHPIDMHHILLKICTPCMGFANGSFQVQNNCGKVLILEEQSVKSVKYNTESPCHKFAGLSIKIPCVDRTNFIINSYTVNKPVQVNILYTHKQSTTARDLKHKSLHKAYWKKEKYHRHKHTSLTHLVKTL